MCFLQHSVDKPTCTMLQIIIWFILLLSCFKSLIIFHLWCRCSGKYSNGKLDRNQVPWNYFSIILKKKNAKMQNVLLAHTAVISCIIDLYMYNYFVVATWWRDLRDLVDSWWTLTSVFAWRQVPPATWMSLSYRMFTCLPLPVTGLHSWQVKNPNIVPNL